MPLYELILITKCTHPSVSVVTLRNATHFICDRGGNVRQVKILADRLLAKQMKTIDRQPSLLGRYTQVLFDGPPSMMPQLTNTLRADKNVLKISFFKVRDFYSHAQEYKKPMETQISQTSPRDQAARRIAILKDQGL